jgi:hypothetical protein
MPRPLPWDDLKVCFGIDNGTERLWRAVEGGRAIFPPGWTLDETAISGASGYVAIFRVEGVPPVPTDAYKVKAELRRWARDTRR